MIGGLFASISVNVPIVLSYCGGYFGFIDWDHMMVWWPFSFFGFWIIFVWVIQIIVAVLIYFDAVKQGKNGLLWLFLVIIPWLGVLFLLMYLVVRGEEKDVKESCEYALNVANERYAKGEITREEFLQVKEDIKKIE